MAENVLSQANKLNQIVESWQKKTERDILLKLNSLNIRDKGILYKSIKGKVYYKLGLADKVGFRFKRYGIFVEKGLGKDTKISQVGKTNRKAKKWLSPVLAKNTPQLADRVAEIFAEVAVKSLKF